MALKSKRRGCAFAAFICLLAVLVGIMVLRLLGDANTVDWPEPAPNVDFSLPYELPEQIAPTNGFYHIKALKPHLAGFPARKLRDLAELPPLRDESTNLAAFVAANPDIARLVRQAAATPFWRNHKSKYAVPPGAIETIQQTKLHRWVLAEQARQGDWAGFRQTAADQLAIADYSSGGALIQTSLSLAVYNIIVSELIEIASVTNVPPEVLLHLDQELAEHAIQDASLANAIRFETYDQTRSISELSYNYFARGHMFQEGFMMLGRLGGSHPSVISQHVEAVYSHFLAQAERDYSPHSAIEDWGDDLYDDGPWSLLGDDPIGRAMMEQLYPTMLELGRNHRRTKAQLGGARLVFAIERFRQLEGRQPKQLDELIPKYLASLPPDPFAANGEVLRGRLENGFWQIYSIGENQMDDGGRVMASAQQWNWKTQPDWVIRPTWRMEAAP